MARRGLAFLIVFALVLLTFARRAEADQPGAHTVPVAVLAFDSEDAEEQADALTGALRSRIRAAQGWSLIETTQSLGMLTAALKCPSRPPVDCQQRIAEQIRAERYIWGFVAKGPTTGQVTAEIHLYQKGKSDTVVRETYADNLRDANDDTLRKIAARIVERLGGTAVGVVVVRAPDQNGEVVIDGEKHIPLKDGTARAELAAGGHAIELAPVGAPITKRNVLVTAGRETVVEFMAPTVATPPGQEERSSFPTRKVIGGATMAVGVGLGALAVVSLVNYLDAQSEGEEYAKTVVPQGDVPCREHDPVCKRYDNDAKTASAIGWVAGGASVVALGVGAFLFFGASDSSEKPAKAAAAPKTRIVPTGGFGSGGLMVVGSF